MAKQNTPHSKGKVAFAIIVIIIAVIALTVSFQAGLLKTGTTNSPTPTPPTASSTPTALTPTPIPTSTQNPTANLTATESATPSPTPLPSPSLSVNVSPTNYNDSMVQYTEFDCTVTINNAAYDSMLSRFVNSQSITVGSGVTGNPVTGNLTTALLASLPQLEMNYGFSSNIGVSTIQADHFTLTFYSATQTVLPGGINTNTLADALTTHLNEMLATQP